MPCRVGQHRTHAPPLATLLICTAVFVLSGCAPKQFESYSLLRVRIDRPSAWGRPTSTEMKVKAHARLIKSPYVIDAALAMPGIQSLPSIASQAAAKTETAWLGAQIQVQSQGESDGAVLLQISMKGDDPQQIATLVNAVTQAYLDRVVGEEKASLEAKLAALDKNWQMKTKEVDRRRELVRKIAIQLATAKANAPADQLQEVAADINTMTEELDRRKEDLATAIQTAHKLALTLQQYDVEMRDFQLATLVQEAPVPKTPVSR